MRIALAMAVLLFASSWAQAQLSCSDIEGASVFSSENVPVYLGFVGSPFSANSINNDIGTYGGEFSSSSVRSTFGSYGSASSMFSAQNQFATQPPKMIRDGVFLAYLSNNSTLPYPVVSLQAIDSSCQFFAPSPAPFFATAAPPTSNPPPSNQGSVESTFSGLWFNPEQDGHGLSISVHSPESVTIFWYTYDPFGFPTWILAVGQFVGQTIVADAYLFFGMEFGTWDAGSNEQIAWGAIDVEFTSCDSAIMGYSSDLEYESGERFGSGVIPLTRLASIEGRECQ